MDSKIHVLLSFNDSYLQHSIVLIHSVLDNASAPDRFIFHVLALDLRESSKSELQKVIVKYDSSITFYQFNNEESVDFSVDRHLTQETYFRIFLNDYLPSEVEKLVYLDADIVCADDLEKLFATDLDGKALGAVKDSYFNRHEILNWENGQPYFNAGVLVIDRTKWNEVVSKESVETVIQHYGARLLYHDQDILNILFKASWKILPLQWNVQRYHFDDHYNCIDSTYEEVMQAKTCPSLIHYTGSIKPWHFADTHPLKNMYYLNLKKTIFADYVPSDRTFSVFVEKIKSKIKSRNRFHV